MSDSALPKSFVCLLVLRWQLFLATVVVLVMVPGCGNGSTGKVEGHILRADGTPVVNARVTARAQDTGSWASDVTDDQGQFELMTNESSTSIPVGEYQVSVVEDEGDWDHPAPPTIAAKYNSPATSEISFSLATGETKSLELKLDPR